MGPAQRTEEGRPGDGAAGAPGGRGVFEAEEEHGEESKPVKEEGEVELDGEVAGRRSKAREEGRWLGEEDWAARAGEERAAAGSSTQGGQQEQEKGVVGPEDLGRRGSPTAGGGAGGDRAGRGDGGERRVRVRGRMEKIR